MLWGFTEKSDFQWSSQKNIATRKEGLPKKGELGEFSDLRGELAKKKKKKNAVWCFLGKC